MRELSVQEIDSVNGGSAGLVAGAILLGAAAGGIYIYSQIEQSKAMERARQEAEARAREMEQLNNQDRG